ncbi:J domain-containing protein [Tautonia marina]|uniref:J domain-containing protein n=1 Tax=Tautonia marina TaxID=2653855 RepID=UPI00126097C1|nr:J domain-containing protein [Tautonia marina]
MLEGLPIDPHTVLGIPPDADSEAIHEAFRRKSKKHHPDVGGDEWAFRIVVRAYELLTQRTPEVVSPPSPYDFDDPDLDHDPHAAPSRDWAAESERVRPGVRDKDFPPARMVLVEVLWFRMEIADIYALLDRTEASSFSGSLHLTWPDPDTQLEQPLDPVELHAVLRELTDAFDHLRSRPNVLNASSRVDLGRFEAWLSYASGRDAWNAFTTLRPSLNSRGLGVRQLTRELTIPREPGESPPR